MDKAELTHPYENLAPDVILDAVEKIGMRCDGHIHALNSYENRVYQIGIEDQPPIIAKFYRPGRWSQAAILEEHNFTSNLAEHEIPAVSPQRNEENQTLFTHHGFLYSIYPRRGGHWPELDDAENLERIGRYLGRIHALGAVKRFEHRPTLSVEHFGTQSFRFLLKNDFVPLDYRSEYQGVVEHVLEQLARVFGECGDYREIRLHGDCHPGNILWTEHGVHFVDFDDCINGPSIQDLWMLLSGDRHQMAAQLGHVLRGYRDFQPFDYRETPLIEALRTLRLLHYSAWLAKRWHDPAFPLNFPWFGQPHYWQEQIYIFREQSVQLQQPPLELNEFV